MFKSFLSLILVLTGVTFAARADDRQDAAILERYFSAQRDQQSALRGATMEVFINASVPKLKKDGRLHALRSISKLGKITYRTLGFAGDNSVKKEVIARYLSAEVQ